MLEVGIPCTPIASGCALYNLIVLNQFLLLPYDLLNIIMIIVRSNNGERVAYTVGNGFRIIVKVLTVENSVIAEFRCTGQCGQNRSYSLQHLPNIIESCDSTRPGRNTYISRIVLREITESLP